MVFRKQLRKWVRFSLRIWKGNHVSSKSEKKAKTFLFIAVLLLGLVGLVIVGFSDELLSLFKGILSMLLAAKV